MAEFRYPFRCPWCREPGQPSSATQILYCKACGKRSTAESAARAAKEEPGDAPHESSARPEPERGECAEAVAAAQAFSELLAEMAENGAWNPAGITWKVFEEHPGWPRKAEEPAEAGSRTTDKQDG